jgi:DUF1009 family protein
MDKIGLIAGNRRFPVIFSEEAKKKGCYIVAAGIKGETSWQLKKYVDKLYWVSLSELSRIIDIFKSEGVKKVIMAGQISPVRLFSREVRNSKEIQELLLNMVDRKANTIFAAIAKKLEKEGLELIDSSTYLKDYMPAKGTLTKRQPAPLEWEDIYFGINLARKVADLDIGLTVAVKNKAIVGVEALEGTDNLIRRAGRIARSAMVVAKVARPNQDMRFDLPVIGLKTIKTLINAKASCLAIEAGKTLFLDMKASLALADKKGIAIVVV